MHVMTRATSPLSGMAWSICRPRAPNISFAPARSCRMVSWISCPILSPDKSLVNAAILQIAADNGIETEVRKISVGEVVEAAKNGNLKEMFGAGTAAVISPIAGFGYQENDFDLPVLENPYLSSIIFGLFFGLIVLPCNPASLVVLFAISTSTMSFITNLFNFLLFGIGMGLPLLLFSLISAAKSKKVIGFLTKKKRTINLISGIIMLLISLYYFDT